MTWQTGTADDQLDIINAIRDVAINRHVATAVINAAGTGYVVDDILTVAGGAGPYSSTLRVTTVGGGGDITGLAIATGGAYTSDPTTTANAVTGGTGTGATVDLTMAETGWTIERETEEVKTVVINAPGANYVVNDKLTLVGGLGIGSSTQVQAAVFNVDTIDGGGGITGISLDSPADSGGIYEEPLGTITGVAVTGGSGNGAATVDVTFGALDDRDKWLVMSGAAGGASDDVTIALRTYQQMAGGGGNSANMAVHGLETFNVAFLMENQNNVSPGIGAGGIVDTTQGAFVPLVESGGTQMEFWFSITDRRILGVVKVIQGLTINYVSFHAGFLNQFGTPTEKPYPIFVAGSVSRSNTRFNDPQPNTISGVMELYGATTDAGPGWYRRTNDGVWQEVKNGTQNETSGTRSSSRNCVLYPAGDANVGTTPEPGWDDIVGEGGFTWDSVISKSTSSPDRELVPTPDTGGDLRVLVPATLILADLGEDRHELVGEVEGLFWFGFVDPASLGTAEGVSEDTFTQAGVRYRIFQNGSRTETFSYMAIRED